ncbi:MAG: hypothetical protein ACW990_14565 [Promethearchaeota archaeon]
MESSTYWGGPSATTTSLKAVKLSYFKPLVLMVFLNSSIFAFSVVLSGRSGGRGTAPICCISANGSIPNHASANLPFSNRTIFTIPYSNHLPVGGIP